MSFGAASGTLRSLPDPGNLNNDFPTSRNSCATASDPRSISNGFNSANNGVVGNNIKSLCFALGYANGTIIREEAGNACPEPHTASSDGTGWDSDWVDSGGSGNEYQCQGFR